MADARKGNRIRLMSFPDRLQEYILWTPGVVFVAAGVCAAGLFFKLSRVPMERTGAVAETGPDMTWAPPAELPATWDRIRLNALSASVPEGSLATRFRLAGTFVAYGALTEDTRKAILDDLQAGLQRVVNENDSLDDVRVVKIYRDHVVLSHEGREEALWLGFSGQGAKEPVSGQAPADDAAAFSDDSPLPFEGKRVGEYRWVFNRESLLDYYTQLRDQPERLVAVFDSLEPLYEDDGVISGYRLNVRGEGDFFNAVGLRQGDVVRAVNTMKMTNRRRAEYFIREFIYDRANAFVLDVERDGAPMKLTYQTR